MPFEPTTTGLSVGRAPSGTEVTTTTASSSPVPVMVGLAVLNVISSSVVIAGGAGAVRSTITVTGADWGDVPPLSVVAVATTV